MVDNDKDRRAVQHLKQMQETAERALSWAKRLDDADAAIFSYGQLSERIMRAKKLLKEGDASEALAVLEGNRPLPHEDS